MVDPLVLFSKLVSQLIQLIQARQPAERNWVVDVVEPVFARFEVAAKEYTDFFRTARNEILAIDASDRLALDKIVRTLVARRESSLEARRLVQQFIKVTPPDTPDEIATLLKSMQKLFKCAGFYSTSGTAPRTLIDVCWFISGKSQAGPLVLRTNGGDVSVDQLDVDQLRALLQEAVNNLEDAWEKSSRLYAKIKFGVRK